MTLLLFAVIVAALMFDFANGMGDSANAIATVVSTRSALADDGRAVRRRVKFIGSFVSISVAMTIAKKMVDPDKVTLGVLLAGMLGAFAWKIFCTLRGLPVSGSHSLLGGLFGAAVAAQGWGVLKWPKIIEALIAMIVSPAIGFFIAYILLVMVYWIAYMMTRDHVRRTFNAAANLFQRLRRLHARHQRRPKSDGRHRAGPVRGHAKRAQPADPLPEFLQMPK